MKQLKWTAAICSTAILFSSVSMSAFAAPTKMRDISTMDYVREMGLGINLGNTFESCGEWIDKWGDGTPKAYETAWGSPVITEDMIKGYADAGFGTLRVPVAWSNLMGDDYTISDAYLGAVQEVVDWALDYNLHVIVNLHYDGGWLANFPTDKETCMTKYTRIWEQISDAFQDYGDYLVFESQNEELGWDSLWNRWSSSTDGKAESYALVNEINQKFVDIVRASGGNNAKRHLLISGYGTDIDLTCDPLFQMPQDPANHCAAVFPAAAPLRIISISACMAGAVCGDHVSPISDTTIMASAGAECKHVHHVSSQLPYALTVAAVSFLTFVVAGFTQQLGIIACAVISWVSGIAMLFSALWGLRRISR